MNDKKLYCSNFYWIFLCAVSITFIVLIWKMIPLSSEIKLLIVLLLGFGIFYAVFSFAERLRYFNISSTSIALVLTTCVFLLFPSIIHIGYNVRKTNYCNVYPLDEKVSVQITYDISRTKSVGSIGSEWSYEHYFNGQKFKDGDTLTINAKTPFSIKSRFIERDSIDDVGEANSSKYQYSLNNNFKKTLTIAQYVHVEEDGGKKNSGASADFKVVYKLKRVIPSSMGFWDMFLYTSNITEYRLCILLIVGQTLCIGFILFVLVIGRKKEILIREQERIRKEKELLAEKTAFLANLQGQSIKQAAGVPSHISFVNDLPRDTNDAPYGSFTVYYSSKGSCYHDKAGCCSSHIPTHYFNVRNRLKPCSKCCTKHREIPQWYTNYISLKKQAQKHQITISE